MQIDAGFFIWFLLTCAALLLMLAGLRQPKPLVPRRTGAVTPDQPAAEAVDPTAELDAETQHWVALGLQKFGYTGGMARDWARQVPSGYTVEQGLQWCLRHRGGRKA
jgi:hypothetical protein